MVRPGTAVKAFRQCRQCRNFFDTVILRKYKQILYLRKRIHSVAVSKKYIISDQKISSALMATERSTLRRCEDIMVQVVIYYTLMAFISVEKDLDAVPTLSVKEDTIMNMPFGKYKGQPVSQIPESYLSWVLQNCTNLESKLRQEIEWYLNLKTYDRKQPSPSADLPGVITQWHRQLAADFHPDRGGSVEAMQAINEAYDRLKKVLGIRHGPDLGAL